MPVIPRIQSVRAVSLPRAGGGAPPADEYAFAAPRRDFGLSPSLVCAAAILAADMLAFAMVAVIAGLAGAALGGDTLDAALGDRQRLPEVALCIAAGVAAYLPVHGAYGQRLTFWAESRLVGSCSLAALGASATCAFLLDLPVPRLPLLATAALFPLAALAMRHLARVALDAAGLWRVPVLVVGEGDWAAQASRDLAAHAELGYQVVATVASARGSDPAPGWGRLLRRHRARLLVLACDAERRMAPSALATLVRERVPYAILPQFDGLPVVGARRAMLNEQAVLHHYRDNLRRPGPRAVKLVFDLVAASAALLVLAPVMLVVAALVGMDGGPVFYAHPRIGARGRVFGCLKFRSMVTDGEAALRRVLESDPAAAEEWARTHKLRRDPRVTWIGRILRRTSLDELPQLLNVLRLEMSLVGPRPIVSLEIPKYAADIAHYYETRPGITGLWQVSGRSDTTYAQRVRLDSWYASNWTLWQDLAILARTVPAVLSGRGAG